MLPNSNIVNKILFIPSFGITQIVIESVVYIRRSGVWMVSKNVGNGQSVAHILGFALLVT